MAGLAGIERIGRAGLAGITGGHCQLPPARGSIRGSHGALRFSLPTRRRRRGGAGGGGKGGGGAVSTHGREEGRQPRRRRACRAHKYTQAAVQVFLWFAVRAVHTLQHELSRTVTNCHEQVAAGAALRRCQVLLQGDTGKGLLDHAKRCHPTLASTKELMRVRKIGRAHSELQ